MNRIHILQKIIDENNFKSYLEIGTFQGESFLPVKCKKKIAVDPEFQITKMDKIKWIWRNTSNLRNNFIEMTSDKFFESQRGLLERGIDLIFIDGLHTFKASLNDCLNSLKYLNQNGLIVMHDCLPPNRAAATPAKSIDAAEKMNIRGWKREWCGDVWKTIYYLRNIYREELEIITLNCDYGLGIIKIIDPKINLSINEKVFNEILNKDYSFLEQNTKEVLNLKSRIIFKK